MSEPTLIQHDDSHVAKFEAPHGTYAVSTELFIGGEWRPAVDGGTFDVFDPASGERICSVADATVEDAQTALDSAAAAQESWGRTRPRERSTILRRAFDLIAARSEDLAWTITREMGKPLSEARGEVTYANEFMRWFSEQIPAQTGQYGPAPDGDYRIITTRQPIGPSLLITPWNFPLAMGTRKVGAALAAGCTVILKPAELTPLTAHLFVDILQEAGVPAGVVNLVTTTSAARQSEALMADPRLRKVSFTGSTGVGSTLLKQAADNVMAASMELGGNGPFVVLKDADVQAAAEGAVVAKFRNAGQVCVAANRIIVNREVMPAFREAFLAEVDKLVVGAGTATDTTVGPLIDEKQRDNVLAMLGRALDEGATLVRGGEKVEGQGWFMTPTVVEGVSHDAELAQSEIFGPVAVLYEARDDDHALQLANDTKFGLVSYLYTEDLRTAVRSAELLQTGMVGVNRAIISEPASPFGGIKASGLGREGGPTGIEEYQDLKYIALTL